VNIFNLKNVIDKPTRISGNTSTLLDPIILSDTLNCNYSDVLKIPRHISDHDAAIAFIKCPKATSRSFTRDIWLYNQTDFVRFNQMLTGINWNEKLCKCDDVDDMLKSYLIKSCLNYFQISPLLFFHIIYLISLFFIFNIVVFVLRF
jgi:hypothetical protein